MVAAIIDWFSDAFVLSERLTQGFSVAAQFLVGVVAGLIIGVAAQWIVNRSFMHEVSVKYNGLIGELKLGRSEIIFISICAGVGEEILFRGALQPLIMQWIGNHQGIWVTAAVFVAIHGYLNPKDWKISVYGVFMTAAIAGLGYLAEFMGIWTAIVAHTVVDYYLLDQVISEEDEAVS